MPEYGSQWRIILLYMRVVIAYWWALLPGVIIPLIDALQFHRAEDKKLKIPPSLRLAAMLGALIVAQFLAYRNSTENLSTVIEEKRRLSIERNTLNSELENLRQHSPLRVEKQKVLVYVPEPSDGVRVTNKTQKKLSDGDPTAPYLLEITLETDRDRQPMGLIIQTDVGMDKRSYAVLPQGHTYAKVNRPERLGNHPDMLGIKWESPAWKPHEPIVVHIISDNPIDLKRVIPNMPAWE